MNDTVKNLTNLLELPGLSNLVKSYTKTSIKVDNSYMNRKQFQQTDHKNTIYVFSYGDSILINPSYMFEVSSITKFTSKGTIFLIGEASGMFDNTVSFNSDLSRWNVENVTNMYCMFHNAASFNSDLSRWNVSNVTNMYSMFEYASSFDSDLSRWNVENVANMSHMFHCAKIFNSDLSKWKIEKVKNMNRMFHIAIIFNSDLSRWIVSNKTNLIYMFCDAASFNSDLSTWEFIQIVPQHENMFMGATSFDTKLSPKFYRIF